MLIKELQKYDITTEEADRYLNDNTGQQKKFFFCYVTNKIVILANLGVLILKIQLVFSISSRF